MISKRNYDGVFLRYLEKAEAENVVCELHAGSAGGHFSGETTAHKVLRASYYCPTLFKHMHIHLLENVKPAKDLLVR